MTKPDAFADLVSDFLERARENRCCVKSPDQSDGWKPLLDEPAAGVDVRAAVVSPIRIRSMAAQCIRRWFYQAAKALGRIGCAVLRFNFRGVGSSAGAFDEGVGESDDFRAGLDFMQQRYQGVRLWAGGFSFGAWIALTVAVQNSRVSTMIGIAPPIARYDMEAGSTQREGQVLHSRRTRRALSFEADAGVLRALRGAEGTGRHRCGRPPFDGKPARSGRH